MTERKATIYTNYTNNFGPNTLNIPPEKIYELGNWNSVATIKDIPEISFNLEGYQAYLFESPYYWAETEEFMHPSLVRDSVWL